MPLEEVSRSRHRDDDAGANLAATRQPDQLLDGLGPGASQLREKLAAAAEPGTQQTRDGQDDMAVGNGREDILAQPLGPQELLLLLARWAEAAAPAGEGDQNAPAALAAPQPGEAVLNEPAPHEAAQHPLDDGTIKTFPLRGIKDAPPYLHDGRLPTLHDAVEFFNLVLETRLTRQEKDDLVSFLLAL